MPTLANTNRVALGFIEESTFGTTPGAGTAKNLRFTGESFNYDISHEASKEIRSDRQTPGNTPVDANSNGGFNFELSYGEYDPFLQAGMMDTYTMYGTNGVGTTFTGTFTTSTIAAAVAPTGSSAFTNLQLGQWIRITAPTNANDGRWVRIHASTAPGSGSGTVITLSASTPATAATSIANCAIASARLVNGTNLRYFSIERQALDVTQYMLYKGLSVAKFDLKFGAGSLTTGAFDFIGKNMVRAGATGLPSALAASQTHEIQNGVSGINQLWEGTAPLTSTSVKSLNLSIENNLRAQTAMGTLGAIGIGVGSLKVSGDMEVYFADGALLDKFLASTYSALVVGSQDPSYNGYVVTMPRIKQTGHKITAGSKDGDLMASISFEAFADDTNATAALKKTIFLDRLGPALAV